MDNALTECAAVDETVVFLNYLKISTIPGSKARCAIR